MTPTRPFRCFDSRIILVALAAAAVMIAAAWIAHGAPPRSPRRILAALAEVAAYVWLVVALVRSVRQLDELEQRIHHDALAAAGVITILAIGGWEFLVHAGLPAVNWTDCALPIFTLGWAFGVVWISRRYR